MSQKLVLSTYYQSTVCLLSSSTYYIYIIYYTLGARDLTSRARFMVFVWVPTAAVVVRCGCGRGSRGGSWTRWWFRKTRHVQRRVEMVVMEVCGLGGVIIIIDGSQEVVRRMHGGISTTSRWCRVVVVGTLCWLCRDGVSGGVVVIIDGLLDTSR